MYDQAISGHYTTKAAICSKKLTDKSNLDSAEYTWDQGLLIMFTAKMHKWKYQMVHSHLWSLIQAAKSSTGSTNSVSANTNDNIQAQNMTVELRRSSRNRKQHTPTIHTCTLNVYSSKDLYLTCILCRFSTQGQNNAISIIILMQLQITNWYNIG